MGRGWAGGRDGCLSDATDYVYEILGTWRDFSPPNKIGERGRGEVELRVFVIVFSTSYLGLGTGLDTESLEASDASSNNYHVGLALEISLEDTVNAYRSAWPLSTGR